MVTHLNARDVTVRFRDGELQTSVGIGTPVVSKMDLAVKREPTKVGENFTHCLSLELANNATSKN